MKQNRKQKSSKPFVGTFIISTKYQTDQPTITMTYGDLNKQKEDHKTPSRTCIPDASERLRVTRIKDPLIGR